MSIRNAKDLFVVDVDIHLQESPTQLAPYCDMPWRRSLENMAHLQELFILGVPGFSPDMFLDVPLPGSVSDVYDRPTHTVKKMRDDLDALDIDVGILFPNHLLHLALLPNIEYATVLARAYNAWMQDAWLGREKNLKGVLVAAPQNPEDAAKEIEKYGKERHIVGVYLPAAAVDPLYGSRKYDPIFQAAQDADLPVLLHASGLVHPAFPFNLHQFQTYLARHALAHPFSMMSNLVSLLDTGVPERFPDLKICFTEAGISWVPFMMYRLDREYLQETRDLPYLKQLPSHYIKNRFFYATQPIEEPTPFSDIVKVFDLYDGENNTMFASDWPHPDFDHPNKLLQAPFSDDAKRKIMSGNAIRFFDLNGRKA
ncbi:MAG: amidohydrolase family protein [Candidatus Promineifilaceae bacterium]